MKNPMRRLVSHVCVVALPFLSGVSHGLTSGAGEATLEINNDWGSGYCANVSVVNNGNANITDWTVKLNLNNSTITNLWNATYSGNTVSPEGYNATIAPGASISFGFCGSGTGSNYLPELEELTVVGGGTGGTTPTATPTQPASVTPTNAPTPTVAPTSTNTPTPTSVPVTPTPTGECAEYCEWYGEERPLCQNQTTGWGYENNQACIGVNTCNDQSGQGGVRTSCSVTPTPSGAPTATPTPTPTSGVSPTPTPIPTDVVYKPIETGCSGYATRFWDCCKPHCGWGANVPEGMTAMQSCSVNNDPLSDLDAPSSCGGGEAHTCYGLAPVTISDTLAFGYAATSSGDVCGRCFQIQFTGESYNAPGDPGSAALEGKTMIIQAINIGYDVGNGQFDLLVPGGGVGAFNACSNQWGIPANELGAQYGGLLAACKQEIGWNGSLEQYKGCLVEQCNSVFGSRGLTSMEEGCLWYADWFEAADNPSLKYKEVTCPAQLTAGSGMDRSFLSDISNVCGN